MAFAAQLLLNRIVEDLQHTSIESSSQHIEPGYVNPLKLAYWCLQWRWRYRGVPAEDRPDRESVQAWLTLDEADYEIWLEGHFSAL